MLLACWTIKQESGWPSELLTTIIIMAIITITITIIKFFTIIIIINIITIIITTRFEHTRANGGTLILPLTAMTSQDWRDSLNFSTRKVSQILFLFLCLQWPTYCPHSVNFSTREVSQILFLQCICICNDPPIARTAWTYQQDRFLWLSICKHKDTNIFDSKTNKITRWSLVFGVHCPSGGLSHRDALHTVKEYLRISEYLRILKYLRIH